MKILIFISFLIVQCAQKNQPLSLTPLSPYEWISHDTINGKFQYTKVLFFVTNKNVKYFRENLTSIKKDLDAISRKYTDTCDYFAIWIYKQSKRTNSSYVESSNNLIDSHKDDQIAEFNWFDGKLIYYNLFSNGRIVK